MRDDGILSGRCRGRAEANTARNGQTVIALVNGDATIKIYHRKAGSVELHPANDTMKPIVVKDTDAFQIEGIVVGVIRHLEEVGDQPAPVIMDRQIVCFAIPSFEVALARLNDPALRTRPSPLPR